MAETRLNNPSLGDGASVGGLTGLSLSVSGSHMERCGVSSAQRDNMSDDASTTALAGTSITGSLSGSCYNRQESPVPASSRTLPNVFNTGRISRMEVQADVQKERCSLSGESATVSLGTMSDNASTKAMAGSILNAYMPLERSAVRAQLSITLQNQPVFYIFDNNNTTFYLESSRTLYIEEQINIKKLKHRRMKFSLET